MYSAIMTATLSGIKGDLVTVETDLLPGLPGLTLVGLPDQSVKESRERVKSAMLNSGFGFPGRKIVVNLSPADRRKDGSHFDLPVAVGILCANGVVDQKVAGQYAMIGELSLNGQIRGVQGALPLVLALHQQGVTKVILPKENREEVELIRDMELFQAEHLDQVIEHLKGNWPLERICAAGTEVESIDEFMGLNKETQTELSDDDFGQVLGQEAAKRCVVLACGGMHGLMMCGSPGVGKTMIASRIPTVLPQLTYEEMLEVTQIYSAAGLIHQREKELHRPPFRSPHYESSAAALIGGGVDPKPGEVSLAHNGVLFLDELPLFKPHVLEALRTPMEDGVIHVSRRGGKYEFPSRFMLVAAANPCRCGYYGDPYRACTCTKNQLDSYRQKMSGPLLDRMDFQVYLTTPPMANRFQDEGESLVKHLTSKDMREQICHIRQRQRERYINEEILYNSQLTPRLINKYCPLNKEAKGYFGAYIDKFKISLRAQHRIIKAARTIADVEDCDQIAWEHLAEALQYRSGWNREGSL